MTVFSLVPNDVPEEMKDQWIRSTKVQPSAYNGGPVFHPDLGIFESLDALRSSGNRPSWVVASKEVPFEFDADELVHDIDMDLPDEAVADLLVALERWKSKWLPSDLTMSVPDETIILLSTEWWQR